MESMKHQNYKKFSQINKIPISLKLASKYFTSLLLFTAFLICSLLLPFMIKTVEFFTLINKNYMFLVCNGLLVFIVKNSGLITNSHQETSSSTIKETHLNNLKKAPEVAEVKTEKVAEVKIEKVTETKKPVQQMQEMEEKSLVVVVDEEEYVLVTEETVESHAESNENVVVVDDEEEDELIELISAEELHKKCEDFIRKMKAGIRLESQQLVLVQ